jgi:hypothetical protein
MDQTKRPRHRGFNTLRTAIGSLSIGSRSSSGDTGLRWTQPPRKPREEVSPPRRIEDSSQTPENSVYRILKKEDSIRLLILEPGVSSDPIRCRIVNVRLSSKPRYEAISYTWGENDTPRTVTVNNNPFEITENLYQALRHFRLPKNSRTLWADAICINQHDTLERSQQVAIMKKLYEHATATLISLGPALPNEQLPFPVSVHSDQLVFDLMEMVRNNLENEDESLEERRYWLAKEIIIDESIPQVSQKDKQNSILNLLSREWFQRIWVVSDPQR